MAGDLRLFTEFEDMLDTLEGHKKGELDAPPYSTEGLQDLINRMMAVDWVNRSALLTALHNELYGTKDNRVSM